MMNITTTSKPVFKLYDCSNFLLSKTNSCVKIGE